MWRTSSYSNEAGSECVEVADNLAAVLIRDTKDHTMGTLTASPEAWSAFVGGAKAAEL
ncbi:DUF397 domain-containing protein [Streptomyces sp. SB3404]|uniref:DUF397 domain-containing protein n=2 Tax=Streptomyces boncukensis TaxID=2711219 RepID=A0A6G4WST2_9ACTN|nr:DUF397 domain-containing protein [Streptomyces boncukensis]NGO68168.1 DUF397 domain-containing protein [Streptomyces boncukensis]